MRGRYAQRPLPGLHGLSGVAVHSGLPDAVEDNLAAFDADGLIQDSGAASADFATAGHDHNGVYEPANANIQSHISSTSNPHGVTKAQVGLTNVADKLAVAADGSQAATADIPMGTHKLTGLAAPAADGDAARRVDTKSYVSFGKSSALTTGMILSAHSIANSPFVAFRAGSVTGLSIQVNSSLSSGYAICFQVYKNGNPGTLTVQRSDSNGTAYAVQATGIDTFAAGDTIDVRVVAPGGGKSHDVDANGVVAIMEITQAPTS